MCYYETIQKNHFNKTIAEVTGNKVRVYVVFDNGAMASAVMPRKKVNSDVQFTDEFNGMAVWSFKPEEFNNLIEKAKNFK